ncbi:hypothetical protein ACFQY0_02485 [Haloferula chungangensis]|uniref:Uncharacterized protein n=1 Tax=Haloferula chungangensis TaxID=1048331 RepID=A0ABW2L111_9BACT
MKKNPSLTSQLAALSLLAGMSLLNAQTIYNEEFDGLGNGYNSDSATAVAGDDDWVDFNNRITTDFSGNEGYFTAVGGTETVLTGASNAQNDPQVRSDFSPGLNQADIGRVELRIRIDTDLDLDYDADDSIAAEFVELSWGFAGYVSPGAGNIGGNNTVFGLPDTIEVQSDGWHLLIWDDNGGLGFGTVNSLRIDPTTGAGINTASFEIDYLRIEQATATPEVELDPTTPIGAEFTLRQEWNWNTDGDQEGWTPGGNGHFTVTGVAGGLLTGESSDNDAQLNSPAFEALDVETGRFIIEIGIVSDVNDTSSKRLFWGLDGDGVTADQSRVISNVPNDGLSHVIRLNLNDVINDRLTSLRYDPSSTSGITSNLDYIRIYSEGPEITPIPDPLAELDPATLSPTFQLQEEWTFENVDDAEGWTGIQVAIANPNDGFTGVFNGSLFVDTTGTDSRVVSPGFATNASASGVFVVEIDYPADFTPDDNGQFFWSNGTGGFGGNLVNTPNVPNEGAPHTVRITLTSDHVTDGVLTGLRFDSTNGESVYYGVEAVRVYTDGPPVSTEAPRITSFNYDPSTGNSEASLVGTPSTVYSFVSATDLDFTGSSTIALTGATVGTLSGGGVQTDGGGNATVQFNLGTTATKTFVRAED